MNPSETEPTPPSGAAVRVPVMSVKPSPKAFVKAVWNFASGSTGGAFTKRLRKAGRDAGSAQQVESDINAMTFAPVALRETGAVYVFDERGLRLEGSAELAFALAWSEVGRVALQVQHSQLLGLKMLRLVLWPANPQTFLAAHPECGPVWDTTLGACTVAVATAITVPQTSVDATLTGLAFAGARFSGEVETLDT